MPRRNIQAQLDQIAQTVPAGRCARGGGVAVADWLVALDDVLVERLTAYTQCGGKAGALVSFKVWHGVATVATVQCSRCKRQDPTSEGVRAVMRRRYGADGKEGS